MSPNRAATGLVPAASKVCVGSQKMPQTATRAPTAIPYNLPTGTGYRPRSAGRRNVLDAPAIEISRCESMNARGQAPLTCALIALVAALLPLSASAGIKCWTNDEGVRECGNAVPPQYSQKGHREISESGITLSTTDRAKSKEELRIEREEAARLAAIRAEEERKIRERETKDRVLLSTYTTEEDLKLAHRGQVAAIDLRIEHTELILKQLDHSLAELRAKAAKLERKGKPITPELKDKIAKIKAQRDDSEAFIEKRRVQKADLAAQFDVDLNRYRELKGIDNKTN
jgi:hypothetical protein